MRNGRGSIFFDPGWMFLIAGLVLVASAALVPATYDLWVMRTQLRHLDAQERENFSRLEAYSKFVSALDAAEPQLVRRLAASQLNLVPRGERPLIVAGSAKRNPIEWVDDTVAPVRAVIVPFPDSLLSRLTLGRKALWIAGAGVMCIFLGLLSAPRRLTGRAPSLALAGIGSAHSSGHPESLSSATPLVRLGHEAPHENDSAAHGAD